MPTPKYVPPKAFPPVDKSPVIVPPAKGSLVPSAVFIVTIASSSSFNASANSFSVFRLAGALSTRAATAASA